MLAALCVIALLTAEARAAASLKVAGSVEQVQVTGAEPGAKLKLMRRGEVVAKRNAGSLGGQIFRRVAPGGGYTVVSGGVESKRVRVLTPRSRPPSKSIYQQDLPAGGYGYLKTRDGTDLAINVSLPGPPEDGPYPTLVEYSGYGYANPAGPQSGIAPVANILGFAVVDVNMRGTGCSGGAFDYFERLQSLDGYDVIETVARQSWVANDKVGMLGISYGGISQLFVAATRPPSLAAITPLSVLDDSRTTLYPGGILNTGFALEWAADRVDDAKPAGPDSGQGWAWTRIQNGDEVCEKNQDLHPAAVDVIAKTRRNDYYRPAIADPLAPIKFVHKIEVPVFMACQWTDEQTGGHCPALTSHFTGTDRKWFTFVNGTHIDSLDPETFNRFYDFLELYVAERKPQLSQGVKDTAPLLYNAFMGISGVQLPDDPIQAEPDYDSALAAFENLRPVRVLFDNGAGGAVGRPVPGFERSFTSFPPRRMTPRSWYLGRGGSLRDKSKGGGADKFKWAPDARPPTDFTGNPGSGSGGLWTASPVYEWTQHPPGRALSYVSRKLKEDTSVLGAGEVQAWVRSSARNVDLQATISEVRPDGKETFVQSGWLRTGARKLDRKLSALTTPEPSLRRKDARTLPKGRWVKVRIPLYYEGHVYRAGSRLRVTVSAPGGDQPIWAFAETSTDPSGQPWVAIAHSRRYPSRLVLPVVPGLGAPTPLPPCPGLRGQPCRDYEPFENKTFKR